MRDEDVHARLGRSVEPGREVGREGGAIAGDLDLDAPPAVAPRAHAETQLAGRAGAPGGEEPVGSGAGRAA